MSQRKNLLGLSIAAFLLFPAVQLTAQSIWLDPSVDRALWLEIQKPDFTDEYLGGGFFSEPLQTSFTTATVYFSARVRLSGLFVLKAELPFINAGIKDQMYVSPLGDTTQIDGAVENQFGNPLLGLEIGGSASSFSADFAVRFPIVDDEHPFSSGLGIFADYDRFEAFFPDLMTFTTGVNYRYTGPTGLLIGLRAGPAFMVVTEGGGDAELFADYSAQIGYQVNRVTLTSGFTGRAIITEGDLNVGERTVHQWTASGSCAFGNFIPGLLFRVPVDDELSNILDFVFGLNLGYRLP